MFQQWIKNLQAGTNQQDKLVSHWMERLSALLLVEIARSDTSIDETELNTIRKAIQSSSTINSAEVEEIIAAAKVDAEKSVSLHEQVRQINNEFDREQKLLLVEQMWRVAFADGDLDKYEESMIRKLAGLIHVSHQEYIQAKLRVTGAFKGGIDK